MKWIVRYLAVRCIAWLDDFASFIAFAAENRDKPQKDVMPIFSAPRDRVEVWPDEL